MFALVGLCLATLTSANQLIASIASRQASRAAAADLPTCDSSTSSGWDYATLTCTCPPGQVFQTWTSTSKRGKSKCLSLEDADYTAHPLAASCPAVVRGGASSGSFATFSPIISCSSANGERIYFYPATMVKDVIE